MCVYLHYSILPVFDAYQWLPTLPRDETSLNL